MKMPIGRLLGRILWYFVMTIVGLFFILPFIWLISSSFKSPQQIVVFPPELIPDPWTLRSFISGFSAAPFLLFLKNSVFITSLSILGTICSSTLVAFGFSRLKAKLKDFWFLVLLSTMMIPGTVTLIPVYVIYSKIGWINTFLPLIVPTFLGGGAFFIFLLRQFFNNIPKGLEEVAKIDGCSYLKMFFRIFVPNIKPALMIVILFSFVQFWNDFFGPMIFLISPEKYTIPVGLKFFTGQYGTIDTGPLMAMSLIAVTPVIILFFVAQRYFIQGIVTTGLKS